MLTTTTATPVQARDRIVLVDVVRGAALYGVLVANLLGSVVVATPEATLKALPTAAVDRVVDALLVFFVHDKANTLFAFLFGLGFSLQLLRAEDRGADVLPLYRRRLSWLFVFGGLHAVFLWWGDILLVYAVAGFLLVLFRRASERTLLATGLTLALVPNLVRGIRPEWLSPGWDSVPFRQMAFTDAAIAARFQALTTGSYADVVRAHVDFNRYDFILGGGIVFWTLYALGRFLLGFHAGRQGWLRDPERHLVLFRRLFAFGLVAGTIGGLVRVLVVELRRAGLADPGSTWVHAARPFIWIGVVGMAGAYLAGLVFAYRRPDLRRFLAHLAPVGQMALTNYMGQSAAYMLLLNGCGIGLGLLGHIGAFHCLLLSVAIFGVQIAVSAWWLRRFQFGPLEWMWRGLTYGRWPPFVRGVREDAEPASAGRP